jgi:cytoskeletal protein CcmA (bactofilin family)
MIFQRKAAAVESAEEVVAQAHVESAQSDDNVDTVVGPSVNVEGDFASEGNIIVKGTVTGSVHTSKNLLVEPGAKIIANVRANSATIAGEVRGNMKVKDYVELTSTARIVGDIEATTIAMEAGALLYGKVAMPGLETQEGRGRSGRSRKSDEIAIDISG